MGTRNEILGKYNSMGGIRAPITPQYTKPAGIPVSPLVAGAIDSSLPKAPAAISAPVAPPSLTAGTMAAIPAAPTATTAMAPMSSLVAGMVDKSLPQPPVALPALPKADLSTGTMAIQPGVMAAQDKGVFVGGIKQPSAMPGTDPIALETWNSQNRQAARMQNMGEGDPNMGYVSRASSNAPGTRAIDMGGMATTNEALAALSDGTRTFEQKKAAWDQAGIDAAKADPARQVHFVPRGPETRDAAMPGPRFVRAPSKAERVAQVANEGALALAGVTGKTAIDVAKQGTLTAVEQAKATEAEKSRRSDDMLKGKEIEAKGRVDAVIAGKKEEASNKFNSVSPADVADAVANYASLRDNPVTYSLYPGDPTKDQEAAYKTDLSKAKAKLAAFGVDENGKKITTESAMPGPVQPAANQADLKPKTATELAKVVTQDDYNKLPVGSSYIDAQGNQRKKAK